MQISNSILIATLLAAASSCVYGQQSSTAASSSTAVVVGSTSTITGSAPTAPAGPPASAPPAAGGASAAGGLVVTLRPLSSLSYKLGDKMTLQWDITNPAFATNTATFSIQDLRNGVNTGVDLAVLARDVAIAARRVELTLPSDPARFPAGQRYAIRMQPAGAGIEAGVYTSQFSFGGPAPAASPTGSAAAAVTTVATVTTSSKAAAPTGFSAASGMKGAAAAVAAAALFL
ncbi:hypothetical protein HDV05_002281 [Chytridiales sp. JEL 0842]|nr:hypothetical protein HDV05_002281 [Chytridiales sp. JEL 0842]